MSDIRSSNSYCLHVPRDAHGAAIPFRMLDQMVDSLSDGDIACIGGCGFGSTVHYTIERLKVLSKRPKLYAFDTFGESHAGSEFWEGHPPFTPWGEPFADWSARIGGPSRLIDQFVFHLANSPARSYLTDWAQFPWWTVAEEFKDDSVSFVIANGAHKPLGIRRELDKWWPKLKSGGKIAMYGHDKDDYRIKLDAIQQFYTHVKASTDPLVTSQVGPNHMILFKP